ncbi:hypothetical protein [uncultured Bacteroides sp.]|uniref:hypothetical protein n=1 Tax=uncultured Bacteroides sp. TaxID=162156 RepID=UPI00263288DB|nr:hypothetical protein [uncultured Bacteroides sp.]
MAKIRMTYAYFEGNDGNSLTTEERIKDAMNLLNGNDSIVLDDGKECVNEAELLEALTKHENK